MEPTKTAQEWTENGKRFVKYPYEPSPGDGWLDTQLMAALWTERWATHTGYYCNARTVKAERGGSGWIVTVEVARAKR